MRRDADRPVELTSCFTETEAAILISKLDGEGIEAQMIGGLTSGSGQAPGDVKVHRARDGSRTAGQ